MKNPIRLLQENGEYRMGKKEKISYSRYQDYAQSANTLFHFMKNEEYLKDILHNRAIIPRYCVENIDYLKVNRNGVIFSEIAVLQKCFCDIPFHKLGDSFPLNEAGGKLKRLTKEERSNFEKSNTHFDYYGKYAISFSKHWGEQQSLQPVHYINQDSQYAKEFSELIATTLADDNLPEYYAQDVINRLSYVKPLRGVMNRIVPRKAKDDIEVSIYKNFHDEREWRYVPKASTLASFGMKEIIANPKMVKLHKEISKQLELPKYNSIWLKFQYDDIRYIIVPDIEARINIIREILSISSDKFDSDKDIDLQKHILISKILVLEEIRRDW